MWWWMACAGVSPTPSTSPQPLVVSPCGVAASEVVAVVVETSVIPIRATKPVRQRFELVAVPEACTGPFCRRAPEADFIDAVELGKRLVELAVVERRSSPHTLHTTIRLVGRNAECELRVGRTRGAVAFEDLKAGERALRELWERLGEEAEATE